MSNVRQHFVRGHIWTVAVAASAAYAVVACLTFLLHFSPGASSRTTLDALGPAMLVVGPYVVLYIASRLAVDPMSVKVNRVVLFVTASAGAVLYSGSFGYVDGEHDLVYFLVPLLQAPLAGVSLGFSLWRRTRRARQRVA